MKILKLFLMLILLSSCATLELEIQEDAKDIVFKDINLISMTSDKIEENMSIYISNGIIKQIGSFEKLDFPVDTAIIKAEGKYLLPGFNDMHVHTYDSRDFSLYLANGITTVRHMSGEYFHIERREKLKDGKIMGPHLYTTGPLTDGLNAHWPGSHIITDPDKVEEYIVQLKVDGYDFVKVYQELTREVFLKIIQVAEQYDMNVVGHIPIRIFAVEAIDAGMHSVEHFEGYDIWAEDEALDELVQRTVDSGIWNCPTLIILRNYEEHKTNSEKYSLQMMPELKYVEPSNLGYWNNVGEFDMAYNKKVQFLTLINEAGANIVSGTDQGYYNPYIVPGFSLHTEFVLMHEAGLSPYEVLRTTTINPAKMLAIEDKTGTIEVGKLADLVLLDKNPLEDIKNTKLILGVMTQGRWLDSSCLEKMLNEVELSFEEDDAWESFSKKTTAKQHAEVLNGDFSRGTDEWITDDTIGGAAEFKVEDEVMVVDIQNPGFENYSVALYSIKIPLQKDNNIRVSFDIKADRDFCMSSEMLQQESPWTRFGTSADIEVREKSDWQRIVYEFTVPRNCPKSQLVFNLGASTEAKVFIDNVVVEVIDEAQ